jgi:hypothetical protein
LGAAYDFQEKWNAVRYHVGGISLPCLIAMKKGKNILM